MKIAQSWSSGERNYTVLLSGAVIYRDYAKKFCFATVEPELIISSLNVDFATKISIQSAAYL